VILADDLAWYPRSNSCLLIIFIHMCGKLAMMVLSQPALLNLINELGWLCHLQLADPTTNLVAHPNECHLFKGIQQTPLKERQLHGDR
jgi:hypothetical protein